MKIDKILITGGYGQLGTSLFNNLKDNFQILRPQKEELNFLNKSKILQYLDSYTPDLIINCAAYTDVEKAEIDREKCRKTNFNAVKKLSEYCIKYNKKLLHISTDYVFGNDNFRKIPWKEYDNTNPLNYYGKTKEEAEKFILSKKFHYLIIRTSGVYCGNKNNNFLNTMLKLFKLKKNIDVVDDQIACPTPSWWLSDVILEIIQNKIELFSNKSTKILHATAKGEVSWYDFAKQILKTVNNFNSIKYKVTLNRVSSENYISNVNRPKYSVLDNLLLNKFGIDNIDWKTGLEKTLRDLNSYNEN